MNLAKPYDQPDFLDFLKDFLPDFEKDISPVNLLHDFKTIAKVTHLGRSETLDLDIYEFKAIGKSQKKISQAIESFKVIKQQMSFRALVSYQTDDDENWRLALLQMTPDLTDEGKRIQKFSNPRRYSFLLGTTAKINTPKKFLDSDKKIASFDDLEKRFSVEVVNKDFYNQIAYFFSRLTGGDRKSGSKQLHFEPEMALPPQSNPDKNKSQEFTVRLIGRIIFCWFLKQKKSKNDLSLLPEKYLSSDAVRANKDYYHNILEKVFFEVLNKPIDDRKTEVLNDFNSIPYLNGGLFDPHEDDHYNGQPFWVLKIPDKWFEEFFEILETYNFTIDENTVIDTDLSIDPEMLGRIFENLLAEINPETGESARKSTGSYYTPRPIVEYMVDQSLILYLLTKTGIIEEKIKALVSIDLEDDQSAPLTQDEKIKVIDALDTVKIIDPACGSGAFPIGILQKIVFMLGQVDSEGKFWFEKKLEGSDPLLSEDIKRKFEKENFDYIRKTGVIRDSIYGVDIQPIAVEVSKLRCFLTLIVDEEIDDNDPKNRGIKPLPNLEFKFVTANTLIGLPDVKQGGLFEDHDEINRLKDVRDRYFVSNGLRKEQLKTEFYRVKNQMSQSQIFKGGEGHLTMALAAWDPFGNKSSEWFDPEWMFGIKAFDIAIANPPYLRVQGIGKESSEEYKKLYKSAVGSYDLYVLFVEKALSIINLTGVVNFIMPHKWINASFGQGLRKITKQKISGLISFKDYQVFNASTYTSLVWFRQSSEKVRYIELTKSLQTNSELSDFLSSVLKVDFNYIDNGTLGDGVWAFSDNVSLQLLKKIQQQKLKVEDIFERIFQGIATGKDSVFFLSGCKASDDHDIIGYSSELRREITIEKSFCRPLLKGGDVHRFGELKSDKVVVFPYFKNEDNKIILYSEDQLSTIFPNGYRYLKESESILRSREDGRFNINGAWYQFSRKQGVSRSDEEKLIMPYLSMGGQLSYDDQGKYYLNTKCFGLIKKNNISESYYYYLAILNSKLMWFYIKKTSAVFRGGYFTYTKETVGPFPIPASPDKEHVESLHNLAKQIIQTKKNGEMDTALLEKDIDRVVYSLYDLAPEEINFIENGHN